LSRVLRIGPDEINIFFEKHSCNRIQFFDYGRNPTQKVISGSSQKEGGRNNMRRNWHRLGILSAAILIGGAPVWAHEDCDDAKEQVAAAAGAGPGSQSDVNITVKLFQFQPGRLQLRAGTMATWVNEDEILHTVTAENKQGGFDALFDGKGMSFSFTFTQPGT
jgi:plastocyanin